MATWSIKYALGLFSEGCAPLTGWSETYPTVIPKGKRLWISITTFDVGLNAHYQRNIDLSQLMGLEGRQNG